MCMLSFRNGTKDKKNALFAIVAALSVGVLFSVLALPARAASPGENGKIVFENKGQILTMNSDGSGPQKLDVQGYDPAWSPDGAKIAFARSTGRAASGTGYNAEIYIMDADGSGQTSLTSGAKSSQPAFSPDGEKIAFVTNRDGNDEIYVMNADGSGQENLTKSSVTPETAPAFSPDGTKIAFASKRDGNYGIYTMNTDGSDTDRSEQKRLTSNSQRDSDPTWSPDGTKIAFSSQGEYYDHGSHDSGRYEAIYTMNTDGSNPQRLSPNETIESEPSWSPDGDKIVFKEHKFSNSFGPSEDLYAVNVDGSTSTEKLTEGSGSEFSPDWGSRPDTPDNTPPDTRIDSGPQDVTGSTRASFEYSSSEPYSTFECSLDDAAFENCSFWPNDSGSKYYFDPVSQGEHTFQVRATDKSGNVDSTPARMTWKVDTIKPSIRSTRPASGARLRDRTPTIRALIQDKGSNLSKNDIRLYVDGRKINSFLYKTSTDRLKFTSKRGFGKHRVKIVARDAAGNTTYKSWRFTVRR